MFKSLNLGNNLIIYFLLIITKQISAQVDTISIKDLFLENKILSISILDSTKIQFHLDDTLINGNSYFESIYNDTTIELIKNRQIEVYGSVKIKPLYISSSDTIYILSWVIPIFFLILVWIPGILAIIYFLKSKIRIEIKIVLIILLILLPISGLIIYPLRKKIYKLISWEKN